jgi:hypothetical protein
MECIVNEWNLGVLQQPRGKQITVALQSRGSVFPKGGQHGMGITLGANIILVTA